MIRRIAIALAVAPLLAALLLTTALSFLALAPLAAHAAEASAASGAGVVAAAHPIRAGTIIARGDLGFIRGEARAPYTDDLGAIIGKQARISMYQGRPIRLSDVGPPTVVERNQIVTMTFRRGALSLRTEGRALDPGGVGDSVRVLNLDSRRTIFATVIGSGHVEAR